MIIYISAKFENTEEVRSLQKRLIEMGHQVATDWTLHKNIKPYKDHPELAREYAIEEWEGIKKSDVFIQLSIPKEGTAFFVELGAAITLNVLFGKPRIYVVGEYNTRTTFYFHPAVERKDTLEEVLQELS